MSFESCLMLPGGRTVERLQMVTVKAGNDTKVVDEIDSRDARVECPCSVYLQHSYLMHPNCHLGGVVDQTAHLLDQ